MQQIFPSRKDTSIEEMTAAIVPSPRTVSRPFSDELVALGGLLSQKLFSVGGISSMPDVASLAFFLRASSLNKLKEQWIATIPQGCIAMPRGRVFHIAPANVEVMFIYSWVISMLCGNSNVVRIPSRPSKTIELLCQCLRESLGAFPKIASSQWGIAYEADNQTTQALTSISQVRVIWGGDSTVKSVRAVESPAGLRDVIFPNRYSWAAIKASFIHSLTLAQRQDLAQRFFQDAYLFDQRACSSPQIVVFVGEMEECARAHSVFLEDLQRVVVAQKYSSDSAHVLEKLCAAALIAAYDNQAAFYRWSAELMSISTTYTKRVRDMTCGGGFFVVLYIRSLNALAEMVQAHDQTLSHAGFDKQELLTALNEICGKGFDRVVPCGQALRFEPVWDGMVLMNEFTRTVRFMV